MNDKETIEYLKQALAEALTENEVLRIRLQRLIDQLLKNKSKATENN